MSDQTSVSIAELGLGPSQEDEEVTESSTSASDDPSVMDPSQTIQATDVVCGRGKMAFNHEGNKRFRAAVAQSVDRYSRETNLRGKPVVVQSIIDEVHALGGRFLKRDRHQKWVELSAQEQRDKVRHAIRDVAADLARKSKQHQPVQQY